MASILSVAWTIPGKVSSQDSSCSTCPLRQSGKTFQKGKLPPTFMYQNSEFPW